MKRTFDVPNSLGSSLFLSPPGPVEGRVAVRAMIFPPMLDCEEEGTERRDEKVRSCSNESRGKGDATETHDELESSLQTSSESTSSHVGILEHVAEPLEHALDRRSSLDDVDEEIGGFGKEDVLEVGNDEHGGIGGSGLEKER